MPRLKPYDKMIGSIQTLKIDIERLRDTFGGAADNQETATLFYAIVLLDTVEDMIKDVEGLARKNRQNVRG